MKRFIFQLLAILLLAACASPPRGEIAGYVDLNDRQSLPPPQNQETVPLKIAVAAVITPKGTVESYAPFLEYVSSRLGRPVELVQRRTYLEINDLVARGDVDVAFVCTSAYVAGHDQFGMELLAAPQVKNETVYYSVLIVPAESPVYKLEDLRGKVFAFTDPISLSGRMYPTFLVQQLGISVEQFFTRTFFTYSHDGAILAVANDLADGAAVDSLVYDYALDRDPSLGERTRVIQKSPPFGIPPVVVSPQIRPQLKAELQNLLMEMSSDEKGRQALEAIGVDQFVIIEDSAYDGVRSLLSDVQKTR